MIRAAPVVLLLVLSAACADRSPGPAPDLTLDFHGLWLPAAEPRRADAAADAESSRSLEDRLLTTWDDGRRDSPHPDIVNAQIRIVAPATMRRRSTTVMLRQEWQIGAGAGESTAQWGERSQRTSPPLDLVPGNIVKLSMPIAVGDMVRRLRAAGKVPWRLAVRVELRESSKTQALAMTQATLPIVAGRENGTR